MRFCPHCGGDISQYMAAEASAPSTPSLTFRTPTPTKYEPVSFWKRIIACAEAIRGTPPGSTALVENAAATLNDLARQTKEGLPTRTIVHLVFDRSVVPSGGVLHKAAVLEGRVPMDTQRLEALGYALENGKVAEVDGFPVGRAFGAIDYWGGEKQHKRWHLATRVEIDPSRGGNPLFMDDNLVAIGVDWQDISKAREALYTLCEVFEQGVKKDGVIAIPLVLELARRPEN